MFKHPSNTLREYRHDCTGEFVKGFTIGAGFGALAVLLVVLALLPRAAHAVEADVFVEYSHGSDFFRGRPFNDRPEWTYDFAGVGATFTFKHAPRLEIDVAQGVKAYDCSLAAYCKPESGTEFSARYYVGKRHANH